VAAEPVARTIQLAPADERGNPPVITALAIDPLGELLAAGGDDHRIHVLRQDDLSEVAVLEGHTDWVRSLAFRPDGSLLASTANDGRLILWKRGTAWRQLQAIEGGPALSRVRFSPNGAIIGAVGFNPQLFLIGPATSQRPPLECGCNDLRALAFSDSNRLVMAAGRTGELHLFDPTSGAIEGVYAAHRGRVRDGVFLQGTETTVTVGEEGVAVVFDGIRREVIQKIRIPGGKLFAVCQLDANRLALGGADNAIYLIDIERGAVVGQLNGHTGSVGVLAANPQYLFSGSYDTTIRRWDLETVLASPRMAENDGAEAPEVRTSRRSQSQTE
jgi:WD40 repeat protein